MQLKPVAAALLGAVLTLGGVAARAADPAATALADNLGRGMATAKSFQAELTEPHGAKGSMTYNKGGRLAMTGAMGPMAFNMIRDGDMMYMRMNGGAWMYRKLEDKLAATSVDKYTGKYDGADLTLLPDRTEGGTAYGAFQTTGRPPSGPMGGSRTETKMTCSYDKSTFRLHICSFGEGASLTTMTYSHWDDPANAIEIPKDAQPFNPAALMGGFGK